jgi:hypothetical protein
MRGEKWVKVLTSHPEPKGTIMKGVRTYAKAKSTPLNPPDIGGRFCSLSYVGEGWGEVLA